MKAMIFAAGLGTRLQPLTDTIPKALVPVAGKPMLEHIFLKLKAAGFHQVVVNVHHFPEQIIDFLKQKQHFGMEVMISDEREQLLDTGGAIKKAAHFFDDGQPFLVHNVDIFSNLDLKSLCENHQPEALATLVVSRRTTSRYLLFNAENRLTGWINEATGERKPAEWQDTAQLNKYAFAGIQVISPRIAQAMQAFEPKFSLIDFYLSVAAKEPINGFIPKDFQMVDIGKTDVLERMNG
ncbi:MAG: nucleotidyltransferase family protein [Bacteroidales bacterium]|jgi:NDP-sugar pyrophosphorylase family protein|nr:nucleotidyltransferase family protein [Bacteroidales bacterium]